MNKPMLATLALTMACAHQAEPVSPRTTAPSATAAVPRVAKPFAELQPVAAAPLHHAWEPTALTAACTQAEKVSDEALARIVAIPAAQRSYANTFGAYEKATADYGDAVQPLLFMKDVHPDEKVRAAGAACAEQSSKYGVKTAARRDIYLALKGFLDTKPSLAGEDLRLVTINMRDFHHAGLDLSDADREKLIALRSRIAELQTRFQQALSEDKSQAEFTAKELAGMPQSYLDRLKKTKDGKFIVTAQYPDFFPLTENAQVEATRHKMSVVFNNRGGLGNLKLLDEAIGLRDQAAKLLGYATHADFVADDRMAKNAKTVEDFETKLQTELKPRLAADLEQLRLFKAKDVKNPKAKLNSWDMHYYEDKLKKRDFAIDDEAVRAYFPADKVMSGMFQVYSTLFGVELEKVASPDVWSPGVELYEVHDKQSGRLLAQFYVDMFPRAGKFNHAACFPQIAAREVANGYQTPLLVLVVNFNPPDHGAVAHLSMEEVGTLFHEFGHVMHGSLTTARYASLSGSNVALDFVEAPSQMLENWVYEGEVLQLISSDPKNPSQSMPADLAKRIARVRTFDAGLDATAQVFYGLIDFRLHSSGDKVDSDAMEKKLRAEVIGVYDDPASHMLAGFGHLMGGYDAGYYGYLWSKVFAADMFTRFEKEGVLNPATGADYRKIILAKGRTEDPSQLLHEFLGREPNEKAFLKLSGVTQ